MSDLKGTINYLKFVRDICKKYDHNCDYCDLFNHYALCPAIMNPTEWSNNLINLMIIAAYDIQKEGDDRCTATTAEQS